MKIQAAGSIITLHALSGTSLAAPPFPPLARIKKARLGRRAKRYQVISKEEEKPEYA
jgi:hypothetical protein